MIFSSTGQRPKSLCHGRLSVVRPSGVNNFGVATITQTNIIQSVSNFGNRKVSRKYKFEYEQIGNGFSALEFLQFFHFQGDATLTLTNIIRSVSNFENKKVKFEYDRNRSFGTGLSALEFLKFFPF